MLLVQMKWCLNILIGAAVLLVAYTALLRFSGWHAEYGEANTVSNEIKWQRYERTPNPDLVFLGSSMGGRVPAAALAGAGRRAVNLCLDGSGPALGAALLQEDEVWPPAVLIEANTLSLPASQNDRTLRSHFRSFHNRLARWLPFCRAESRPVTVLFSRLKQRMDARRADSQASRPITAADVQRLVAPSVADGAPAAEEPMVANWIETVRRFRKHGSRVVIVMLPDGGRDRRPDYAIARRLAAEGALFLDVKGAFPEDRFHYTDGLHLIRSSGEEIAGLIAQGVQAHRGAH